jgi:hypothetical protein
MASIFFTERLPGTSKLQAARCITIAHIAPTVRYPVSGVNALPPHRLGDFSLVRGRSATSNDNLPGERDGSIVDLLKSRVRAKSAIRLFKAHNQFITQLSNRLPDEVRA